MILQPHRKWQGCPIYGQAAVRRDVRSRPPNLQESNRVAGVESSGLASPARTGQFPPRDRGALVPSDFQRQASVALPVNDMNSAAVLTFVLIAGIVWGGFAIILMTAVRKESGKTDRS